MLEADDSPVMISGGNRYNPDRRASIRAGAVLSDFQMVGSIDGLKSVAIENVTVTDEMLTALCECTTIKELFLRNVCGLSREGAKVLAGLDALFSLSAQKTDCRELVHALSRRGRMESITITDGNLTDADVELFCQHSNLTTVELCDNEITGSGFGPLSRAQNLEKFFITEPALGQSGFAAFGRLRSVRQLGIQFEPQDVKDEWMAELSQMPALRELTIVLLPLSGAGYEPLRTCQKLRGLHINFDVFADPEKLAVLGGIPQLQKIVLLGGPVPKELVTKLRATLKENGIRCTVPEPMSGRPHRNLDAISCETVDSAV